MASPKRQIYSLDDVLAHQQDEFELGGRRFLARQLTLAESLLWDNAENDVSKQLEALARFLSCRAGDTKPVEPDWLGDQLTHTTGTMLLQMLRTGAVPKSEDKEDGGTKNPT